MSRLFKSRQILPLALGLIVSMFVLNSLPSSAGSPSRTICFVNGLWFTGSGFEPKTMYSVDGELHPEFSGSPETTVDLQNRYVVPPFGEAHNHQFQVGMDYQSQIQTHLKQGVFYARNPNSMKRLTDPIRHMLNVPSSVDVLFSGGGLTASGGHPIQIYDFIGRNGVLAGVTSADMPNSAYFLIDTERDLDEKWPLIKAGKPDFIKTYLEFSEEYELRRADAKYYGRRGLDPALLPKIVAKAHADGLRVTVHVNSAADFHNGVMAGADEIAHLPLAPVSEADARVAAEKGVVVVTTTLSHRDTGHVRDVNAIHRANLSLLRKAGVRLAVGTDNNQKTAFDEVENLRRLNVFDNLTLLKLWSEDTPRAIFPNREIGRLADGYEASFLVLDGNPIEDFSNVAKIVFRFKQGTHIDPPVNREKDQIEQRREDLRFMAERMRQLHKNLFHTVTPEQFDAAVKSLDERIPTLSRPQFIVGLMRIVAMIGDGHTSPAVAFDPAVGFHRFPVKLYVFKDGIFVTAAEKRYAALVGGKLIRIGDSPAAKVFESVSEVVSRDNEQTLKNSVPFAMTIAEVLQALGHIPSSDKALFTVEKDGRETTVEVLPIESGHVEGHAPPSLPDFPSDWVDMRSGADAGSAFAFRPKKDAYWFEYLKDSRTVYVQYNECENKRGGESIEAFSNRLFEFVASNDVERFILDLRWNTGGNLFFNKPLLLGIIKSDKINQRGKLFALIGRTTFSAAQNLVGELERYTNVLFVGEPTGARPNHYGDHAEVILPNSRITVFVSTLWHQELARERRRWTPPHVAAELSSTDYRNNIDLALMVSSRYVIQKPVADRMLDAVLAGDMPTAAKLLREFKADPTNAYASAEVEVNALGYKLLGMNHVDQAVQIFRLNAEAYPKSSNVHDSLGEALMKQGNRDDAITSFEKSLELNPANANAVKMLEILRGQRK